MTMDLTHGYNHGTNQEYPLDKEGCGASGVGLPAQSSRATTHKPEKGVHLVPPRHECIRTIEQNRRFKLYVMVWCDRGIVAHHYELP